MINFEEQTRGWLSYPAKAKPGRAEVGAYDRLHRHLRYYSTMNVLAFTDLAAAELRRLQRLGLHVGTMDLKIAAIALIHDATVVSRNVVDFKKIPGLRVEDWTV